MNLDYPNQEAPMSTKDKPRMKQDTAPIALLPCGEVMEQKAQGASNALGLSICMQSPWRTMRNNFAEDALK